jgi:hypothetical protein
VRERRLTIELRDGNVGRSSPLSVVVSAVARPESVWSVVPQVIANELGLEARPVASHESARCPVLISWCCGGGTVVRTIEEVHVGGEEVVIGSTVLAKLGVVWEHDVPRAVPIRMSFRSSVKLRATF